MLETIKARIFEKYKKEDNKGIFFSLLDKDGVLLASTGVLDTDKPLGELVDIVYAGLLDKEKNVVTVVVDVVTSVEQETDMKKMLWLSTKEYGVFIINNEDQKSGVMLPNLSGVVDVQTALGLIKKKYSVTGNVLIYVFKTDRFAFNV